MPLINTQHEQCKVTSTSTTLANSVHQQSQYTMSLPTSPASAAAGAAPGPPATFTPSGINPAGAIPQLWIPVALLAHIFAIAFLVKFFLLLHPDLPGKARSRLRELLEAGRARWGGRPGCGQARVAAEEATGAALAAVVEAAKMKAADGELLACCWAGLMVQMCAVHSELHCLCVPHGSTITTTALISLLTAAALLIEHACLMS